MGQSTQRSLGKTLLAGARGPEFRILVVASWLALLLRLTECLPPD